ncbi:type II secretion system F family protein [Candidatus Poriferisodalis sp.]|uniref:type II secretion system F family protein n=1 Tax=Candidatus Poriferisodalis sp. TaxID=3101277 RepID=UPI003B01B1CB
MIAQALVMAVATGVGVVMIVAGLRRRPSQPLPGYGANLSAMSGATRRAAGRVERELRRKQQLSQDAEMVGRSLESHALAKLGGLVVGAVLLAFAAILVSVAFSIAVPAFGVIAVAAGGALLGWWLPDSIMQTDAENERDRFQQSAEAWLELVAQLVTAGADTHAALHEAAGYSNQPAFAAIRDSLLEASAVGEPPWVGLRRLAEARRLRFMDPFIAALELAGTTGAGARQAILSQVDAARSKSLAAADAEAASASEKMGAPLALIGGAFMMLMGYPPLAGVLNTDSVPSIPTGL